MNTITTVQGIGRKFRELVGGLDVDPYYKVFHTTPQHDGSPHIEKEGDQFCVVVTERGSEFQRIKTTDPNEILYILLDSVTQVAATAYESRNRVEGKDGREVWFPYQEQLLYHMKPEWGVRKQKEHFRILRHHPLRYRPFQAEPRHATDG